MVLAKKDEVMKHYDKAVSGLDSSNSRRAGLVIEVISVSIHYMQAMGI